MRSRQNIRNVVREGLCHGCGLCSAVCPNRAISMANNRKLGVFTPELEAARCVSCGLCLETCSGSAVDFISTYQEFFGAQPEDPWLGIWRRLLIAYSADERLRHDASSGGALSELLRFSLKEKLIDGALVARMKRSEPLTAEAFIARSAEEIIAAKGSKYCPVHIGDALLEILNADGRYAVVGLPCHLHGLAKLFERRPDLRARIPYVFGLMCSNNATRLATEYLLRKNGIDPTTIHSFRYRGSGWPGSIGVDLDDGTIRQISRHRNCILGHAFHGNFTMRRCLTCCDHMAEFSDISFGDPRYPEELRCETEGKTLMVCRTEAGEALCRQAFGAGAMVVHREVSPTEFYSGQNLAFKRGYVAHLRFRRLLGLATPEYASYKTGNTCLMDGIFRILTYLPSYVSHWELLKPMLMPYSRVIGYLQRARLKFARTMGTKR